MIAYLLKVTICWLLFYIVYHFLLSKETFFRINRWYLLSTLLIGLILPLFQFDFSSFFEQEPVAAIAYASESFHQMEVVITSSVEEAEKVPFSWLSLLLVTYWIGLGVAFIRFLYGFNQIFQLYRTGAVSKKQNYYLVITNKPHLPFSFFNHIFWYESINLEDIDSGKIISHETAHIDQGHSADVLFLELLGILLWFSPPIYWYKKSLRAVHEFLADAYVLRDTKKKQYGHLLIKQAQSGMQVALANNFIHSQLKKRINMMTRNKSRRKALMRYLPALPILLIAVLLFASKNNSTDLEATYLQSFIAFEQMLDGDFDPQKAKEVLAEAYLNGSKLTKDENGKSVDWDAHKIGALERRGNRLVEIYPENKADILLIMMEVAAENGYALRLVGTRIESYREIEKPVDGKEIKMVAAVEDISNENKKSITTPKMYLLTPNGDGKNDVLQIEDLSDYSNNTLDIYNKWGDMIFSAVNYMNDWNGKDLNTGELLPEATYYYQLKSTVNDKSKQGYIQLKRTEIPVFTDGEREMLHFIYKNIKYPALARENGTYGTVIVEFTVKKDGSIVHPHITKDVAHGLGQEALRIVKLMQGLPEKWTPGRKEGEAVDMKFTLPVQYRLEGLNNLVLEDGVNSFSKVVVTGLYTQNDKPFKEQKVAENGVKHYKSIGGKSYGANSDSSPILEKTTAGEPIYRVVDKMPYFPGCEEAEGTTAELKSCADRKMLEFIYTNIKYPKEARDKDIQGTVVIRFLVEKDGSLSGAKIVRNVGGGTGEEALRVINLMKEMPQKWISGRQDGEAVNVYYNIPIKFKLAEEETAQKVVEPTQSKSPIPTQTAAGEPIYKEVDEMPRFPGCEEKGEAAELKSCADRKMLEFIYTNIKYPQEARDKGIQGVVVIRFLVEKDGSISGTKIVRNVGGGTGEEALKVVNMMAEMPQKWIPGREDGKAVNVIYNLPIKFKLAEEETTEKATEEPKSRLETIAPKLERGAPEDAMELTLSGKKVVLNAFPNPAKEKLTITMEGQAKKVLLTVFDVTGKELYRKDIKIFDGVFSETINLDEAAKGALIINVNHEGLNIQKKVIVH